MAVDSVHSQAWTIAAVAAVGEFYLYPRTGAPRRRVKSTFESLYWPQKVPQSLPFKNTGWLFCSGGPCEGVHRATWRCDLCEGHDLHVCRNQPDGLPDRARHKYLLRHNCVFASLALAPSSVAGSWWAAVLDALVDPPVAGRGKPIAGGASVSARFPAVPVES